MELVERGDDPPAAWTVRGDATCHPQVLHGLRYVAMARSRLPLDHLLIGLIALFMLLAAVQAAFWPQSFADDFPFGRGWLAATGGTYDEHLVRDVGALLLALIVATTWTVVKRLPSGPIAAAWLVQGVLHFAYHIGHLDGLDTVDQVLLAGSLVAVPVMAGAALVIGGRR